MDPNQPHAVYSPYKPDSHTSPLSVPYDGYFSHIMFAGSQGQYSTASGDNYAIDPGAIISNHGNTGGLIDATPAECVPRDYHSGFFDPNMNTASSTATSSADPAFSHVDALACRDSSEERGPGPGQAAGPGHYPGPFGSFLPSPPDAEDEHCLATPAISPHQTTSSAGPPQSLVTAAVTKQSASDRRKRKRHSTPMPSTIMSPEHNNMRRLSAPGGAPEKRRPATQLRTASRAPKTYTAQTARKAPESKEEAEARAAHNQVEQQYRKRLNTQFEKLLAVLPSQDDEEAMDEEGSGGHGGGGAGSRTTPGAESTGKRISKAEVLDLARKRIRELEKENLLLSTENRSLRDERAHIHPGYVRRLSGPVPKLEPS